MYVAHHLQVAGKRARHLHHDQVLYSMLGLPAVLAHAQKQLLYTVLSQYENFHRQPLLGQIHAANSPFCVGDIHYDSWYLSISSAGFHNQHVGFQEYTAWSVQ
jgi:hypothetical protein